MKYDNEDKDRKLKLKRIRALLGRNKSVKDRLRYMDKCPVCGKELKECYYNGSRGINPHIKFCHSDYLIDLLEEKEKDKEESNRGSICPLCDKSYINMGHHVLEYHKMKWEDFLSSTGFKGNKYTFTDSHKEKLSSNKKKFYKSERGLDLRKKQSDKISGINNPACREEVRKKISDKHIGRKLTSHHIEVNSKRSSERLLEGNLGKESFGYYFQFIINDKYFYARSFEELKVILTLLKGDIEFLQEPCIIEYYDRDNCKRCYIPDFLIGGNYFETKCTQEEFEDYKYKSCKKVLKGMGKDLRLLRSKDLLSEFGIRVLSNEVIYSIVREMLLNNSMIIIKPKMHHGRYKLLENILGDSYEEIIENPIHREVFNENKERIIKKNRRIRI